MKKFALFAGFVGGLFMVAGAFAADEGIKTASTNKVRRSVYDITYGNESETLVTTGANNDYNYRHGTVPQTAKLESIEGTSVANVTGMGANDTGWRSADLTASDYSAISNITVGNLAADTGTTDAQKKANSTIKNNKANVAVLKRDKLSIASSSNTVSNCTGSGVQCGYVTTGNHANLPADASGGKVWMKIALACDATGTCSN